jgi:excisionase family DNA binding protein
MKMKGIRIKKEFEIGSKLHVVNPRTGEIEAGSVTAYAFDSTATRGTEPTGLMVKFDGDYRAVEVSPEFLPPDTMTIPEASDWYSIPKPTLYRAAAEGRLDARKSGGTWLVAREAMEAYAAEYEPRHRRETAGRTQAYTIRFEDYTDYHPQRCRTGGQYAFYETARVENGQIVDGKHRTSAEFGYCQYCGRFEQRLLDHEASWHDDDEYLPSNSMAKIHDRISDALTRGDTVEEAVAHALEWFGDDEDVVIEVA